MIDENRIAEISDSGFSVDEWREMIVTLRALWKVARAADKRYLRESSPELDEALNGLEKKP